MSTTEKNGRKKAGAFEIHITGDGRKVQSDAHGEIEDLLAGGGYFLGSILKQIGVQEGTEEFAEISGGIMEAVSHYLKEGVNGDPEDSFRQTAEKVYEKKERRPARARGDPGRRSPRQHPGTDRQGRRNTDHTFRKWKGCPENLCRRIGELSGQGRA